MLVLTRKLGENIFIGEKISVKIVNIEYNKVKVGISAPENVSIYRQELVDKVKSQNQASVVQKSNDFISATKFLKNILHI